MDNRTLKALARTRRNLIHDLKANMAASRDNLGGWATDRLNGLREIEWDLAEAGYKVRPWILSHKS